jgi:hypothetical protein
MKFELGTPVIVSHFGNTYSGVISEICFEKKYRVLFHEPLPTKVNGWQAHIASMIFYESSIKIDTQRIRDKKLGSLLK